MFKKLVVMVFLFSLISCDQADKFAPVSMLLPGSIDRSQENPVGLLKKIKQRGVLTILTTNLPITYYYDREDNLTGPEYDMTQSFAKSLQVKVEYKVFDTTKVDFPGFARHSIVS